MDGGDGVPPVAARPTERVARDALGSEAGDDLQAGHNIRHHLVLETGVEVLGVLAEDRQVDEHVAEARHVGCHQRHPVVARGANHLTHLVCAAAHGFFAQNGFLRLRCGDDPGGVVAGR